MTKTKSKDGGGVELCIICSQLIYPAAYRPGAPGGGRGALARLKTKRERTGGEGGVAHPIMYLSLVFSLVRLLLFGSLGAEEIWEPYYDGYSGLRQEKDVFVNRCWCFHGTSGRMQSIVGLYQRVCVIK